MLDKARFNVAFNYLAAATRLPVAELTPENKRVFFNAMQELDTEAVERAAEKLAKESQWFPKAAEWITAAKLAHRRAEWKALMPAPGAEAAAVREWKHECKTCEDSGFEVLECKPGQRCYRRICKRADEANANQLADLERAAKTKGRELTEAEMPSPYTHRYTIRCFCVNTNRTYQRQWKAQFAPSESA